MYFSMMPKMLLNLDGDLRSYKLVTDITTRVSGSSEIRKNVFLYDTYDIQDNDTPEIIASKVYNDPQLHWVILLCNDIIDPVYDWLLPYDMLLEHTIQTYGGVENIYKTHHYENENGDWVSADYPNAARITNMEYEERENEKKRTIRILQPTYVTAFVNEVETKLSQQIL